MIELANVTKTYSTSGGEVRALDDVSLSIDTGEFVCVRGPSGCGKSTLLALLGGLAQPTSGSVIVDGREVSAMSSAQRAAFRAETIGFVFQMFHLLPYLNIVDNVLVAAPPGKAAELRPRAMELLGSFGLSGASRTFHRNFLSANASAWRWPGRCLTIRGCCWPTNRLAILMRRTPSW